MELGPAEAKKFRSIAALANYVAMDRPDSQVAVSILCQKHPIPPRRAGRSSSGSPGTSRSTDLRFEYREGSGEKELLLQVFADSDWAGCKETRKSRSGASHCSAVEW